MNASGAATSPVITGIGVVAPTGIGIAEHWQSVLAGKSGVTRITRFDPSNYPVRFAGQLPNFLAEERVPGRLIPQTDRWTHLGLAAAEAALADADVRPAELPDYEMAVVTASSSGGTEFGQHEMERLYLDGPSGVGAYQSIAWFYAATTGQISIRFGMRGPSGVLCCEQAGGLDALNQARRLVHGGSRLVLSGGTDASLCPYGLVAQLSNGKLSTVDDQNRAYLPFDAEASGYLPGEGGAILIVESARSAQDRDKGSGYGAIAGHAAGFDPPPGSARPPALRRTIERALADARVNPEEVDVVFADAAGVRADDLSEAQAISAVFGSRGVPVTAPKTLTGRLYGGGASLDVATALLAIRDGVIPHTVGSARLAPGCELDLVTNQPRDGRVRTALVLARGHGGFNAALVLTDLPRAKAL
ncbi:ketosynthase chain-length factor [Amycolatopsis coloradensis]|uniref:Ketosynthase chain-length factor n=1 Tax=Amycolatopsis coloradensis TaxID=76021 RepID=A0ACD5BK29_9PSEU